MNSWFYIQGISEPDISVGIAPDVPYMSEYPWLFDGEGPVAPLHECVWDFFAPLRREKKRNEIIHHIDGNKLNATIENLGIGSRSAHGLAHALQRQRFTRRKRWNLFGWFRPPAMSPAHRLGFIDELRVMEEIAKREQDKAALRERLKTALQETQELEAARARKRGRQPPPSSPSSGSSSPLAQDRKSAEQVLACALPRLRGEVDHLDSGKKIPPPSHRPVQRDRLLGISRIGRGCTPGEAALVRLLVKNQFDLEEASRDGSVSVAVINEMLQEPAVDLAIRNWRGWKRLPPPCPPKKVRPYRKKASRGT